MSKISIRDLRSHGGEVVERAQRGERLTITRSGKPVAQLVELRRAPAPRGAAPTVAELPEVDPAALRSDIGDVLDSAA